MSTLIIDNYDSFTFNLVQMIGSVSGSRPIVVRNDEVSWAELKRLSFDEIVISPGPGRPDRPEDFGVCAEAIRHANVPILGVCLGHQGIGHLFGIPVEHAPEPMHGRNSPIHHDGSDLFRQIPSPFNAVRYHSLILPNEFPDGVRRTAWTADGLTMGLEIADRPIWGVQFHPESICTDHGRQLLSNFLDLSQQYRSASVSENPPAQAVESRGRVSVHHEAPANQGAHPYRVRTRKLKFAIDTERAFSNLFGQSKSAFWLDSSQVMDGYSRFSFMGDASGPHAEILTYDLSHGRTEVLRGGHRKLMFESIFDYLEQELRRRRIPDPELPFDFCGGWVGFLGYDLKALCGAPHTHETAGPDASFIFADRTIVVDHREGTTWLIHLAPTDDDDAGTAETWFDRVEAQLCNLPAIASPRLDSVPGPIHFYPRHGRNGYIERIEAAQRDIHDGESYEVCLTNRFSSRVRPHPLGLYRLLRDINPAPYAAFLNLPRKTVLSSSPERFLKIDRNGWIEAKPIKGTLPRGRDPDEDARLAEVLRTSEKDRAENLMIVDLLRNDLGLVCDLNTVSVPKLMDIESYATVHQMVSTITGHLKSDRSPIDAVMAAFPGGSMTGAPKIRTMEIIDDLEGGPRGVYSGAIGFISLNGTLDLNIVIRTVVMDAEGLSIDAGGAITHLSSPALEYEEMTLKALAPMRAVALACTGNSDRFEICDDDGEIWSSSPLREIRGAKQAAARVTWQPAGLAVADA